MRWLFSFCFSFTELQIGNSQQGISYNGGELAPFNRRLVGNGASLLLLAGLQKRFK